MSVVLPDPVLAVKAELGPNGVMVYTCLAETADERGQTTVSYDVLGEMSGLCRSAIARALSLLAAHGLITKQRRFSQSTVYTVVHFTNYCSSTNGLMSAISSTNGRLTTTTTTNTNLEELSREEVKRPFCELMDEGSSDNGLLAQRERDDWQRMTDAQQAEWVFRDATGMLTIPSRNLAKDMTDLGKLISALGRDGAVVRLREAFADWKAQRTQEGRPYSPINTGFIEWAVNDYRPPARQAPEKRGKFGQPYAPPPPPEAYGTVVVPWEKFKNGNKPASIPS